MPTIPIRQRLLQGAFKYAHALQTIRRRTKMARDGFSSKSSSSDSVMDVDSDRPRPGFNVPETGNDTDSDLSSLASLSSLSSLDSLSSLSSEGSGYMEPGTHTLPGNQDHDSEHEEDQLYYQRQRAIRDHIDFLENTRVLHPNTVQKVTQLYLVLETFKESDPRRFRRNLRVLPDTFDALLAKIHGHPIFAEERQMPVEHQLAIALFRFGHFGNAASVESVAQWAGCSAGMVVNATRRVQQAFLSLHDEVIHWPSSEEKEAAKEWVEAASCAAWRDGWLFVDGTLVPLAEKPGHHGEAYFDRKSNYSLNVQLITLPNLRIIDYVIGHCGSAHDSTVFSHSRTVNERQRLIGPGEWIWADSAYPIEAWCVTPYKKPASNISENKVFNFWVSHVRIKSEHAVGHLKGRFQSLRGLRQQIKNEIDHLRAVEWIRTCIVIHTLIHEIESEDADMDFQEELIEEGISSADESVSSDDSYSRPERQRESTGQRKRRKVKQWLYESGLV